MSLKELNSKRSKSKALLLGVALLDKSNVFTIGGNQGSVVVYFKPSLNYQIRTRFKSTKSSTYTLQQSQLSIYDYEYVPQEQLNLMSLTLAEKSFAENWDINDQEANDYWDSF